MLIIVYTDTNRSRVINREEFYRYEIEKSFKEYFSSLVVKSATNNMMKRIRYSDVQCIIVHNNDMYAVDETNRTFEIIDEDEFEEVVGCYSESQITDSFCAKALRKANESLKRFVLSRENGVGFKTTVLEEYPVVSFDCYGNLFLVREGSKNDYMKNFFVNQLKSGFSEKYAKVVADDFFKKFISRSMLTVETENETFYITWKNDLQVVSCDDGKTYDAIRKFIKPYCKGYKKIVIPAADFLNDIYFH